MTSLQQKTPASKYFPSSILPKLLLEIEAAKPFTISSQNRNTKTKTTKKNKSTKLYKPSLTKGFAHQNQPKPTSNSSRRAFPKAHLQREVLCFFIQKPFQPQISWVFLPFSPVVVMFWLVGHIWSVIFTSRILLDNYVSSAKKDETLFQWGFSWPSDTLVSKPAGCWNQSGFSTVGSKCRPTKFFPNNLNSFCSFQR